MKDQLARTCHAHLAGMAGVAVTDRLVELGWLQAAGSLYELTPPGAEGLQRLGVQVHRPPGSRRKYAYPCLDRTERRPHLGGWLGEQLLEALLRMNWFIKLPGNRALFLTETGRGGLMSLGAQL